MKCPYCKGENPRSRTICVSCGGPLDGDIEAKQHTDDIPNDVKNYLLPAVISLIICQPLGIVAFVYAYKAMFFLKNERYDDASMASQLAKRWCWITFGVGIFLFIAGVILYILSFFGIAILSVMLGSIK